MGYRVPRQWCSLSSEQRELGSLEGFKKGSREGFLAGYRATVCAVRDCYVCSGENGRNMGAVRGGLMRNEGSVILFFLWFSSV